MSEDVELLRRYATDHSEVAFAELIQRHVDLVYCAASRLCNGDAHRAQDVTQQVFSELARQSKRLANHPALTGWLYTTTRRVALHSLRADQRRAAREQEATSMNELVRETGPQPDWEHLRPVLEDAMHDLGEKDRLAVLLRYFQNKSLNEVGEALGLGENAARMRVDRALGKLRLQLARRGVTSTTAALALTLTGNVVTAAPPAFVATLASTSLAGAAAGTGTTLTLLKLMAATKLKAAIVSTIVIASVATSLVIQHQARAKLDGKDNELRRQTEQVTQLTAERERLSDLLAQARSSLPDDRLHELLRLRGQVGLLRQQSNELGVLRDENRRLQAALADSGKKTQPGDEDPASDDQRGESIAKMNYTRNWLLAFQFYAQKNQGQFPTNFDQAAPFLPDEAKVEHNLKTHEFLPNTPKYGLTPERFEIVQQGSPNTMTNPSSIIVLREKEAWPSYQGGWNRTYSFGDGHSEIHYSKDGDYEAWEKEHMRSPPAPNP